GFQSRKPSNRRRHARGSGNVCCRTERLNEGATRSIIRLLHPRGGETAIRRTLFLARSIRRAVLVVGEPSFHVALLSCPRVALRLKGDPADNIPFFYDGFAKRAKAGRPGDGPFSFRGWSRVFPIPWPLGEFPSWFVPSPRPLG